VTLNKNGGTVFLHSHNYYTRVTVY